MSNMSKAEPRAGGAGVEASPTRQPEPQARAPRTDEAAGVQAQMRAAGGTPPRAHEGQTSGAPAAGQGSGVQGDARDSDTRGMQGTTGMQGTVIRGTGERYGQADGLQYAQADGRQACDAQAQAQAEAQAGDAETGQGRLPFPSARAYGLAICAAARAAAAAAARAAAAAAPTKIGGLNAQGEFTSDLPFVAQHITNKSISRPAIKFNEGVLVVCYELRSLCVANYIILVSTLQTSGPSPMRSCVLHNGRTRPRCLLRFSVALMLLTSTASGVSDDTEISVNDEVIKYAMIFVNFMIWDLYWIDLI